MARDLSPAIPVIVFLSIVLAPAIRTKLRERRSKRSGDGIDAGGAGAPDGGDHGAAADGGGHDCGGDGGCHD